MVCGLCLGPGGRGGGVEEGVQGGSGIGAQGGWSAGAEVHGGEQPLLFPPLLASTRFSSPRPRPVISVRVRGRKPLL